MYARVAMAGVELGVDTELSCHVVSGSRKDWQTGEVSRVGDARGGDLHHRLYTARSPKSREPLCLS